MGCGGSKDANQPKNANQPKKQKGKGEPCSEEQKTEMFELAVKDMMLLCARQAIEKGPDWIVIKMPDQDFSHVDQLIKEVQAIAPPTVGSTPSTNTVSATPSAKKKGMMDRGKDFLKDAKSKAETMAKRAGANPIDPLIAALGKHAEDLVRIRDDLQAAFDECGSELFRVPTPEPSDGCRLGKIKLFNVFACCIQNMDFASANVFDLVRGKEPYGAQEYKSCQSDKVTAFFANSGSSALVTSLGETEAGIEETAAVKAWIEMDKTFQTLNNKVGKISPQMKKPAKKIITPDELKLHIANQFVKQLGEAMAVEEARQRDLSKRKQVSQLGCSNVFNLYTCFNALPALDKFMVNAHYNKRISPVVETE